MKLTLSILPQKYAVCRLEPNGHIPPINDLLFDLRHLEKVMPVEYKPDTPRAHIMRQRVILVTLVTISICLAIVALGFLVQYLHYMVR